MEGHPSSSTFKLNYFIILGCLLIATVVFHLSPVTLFKQEVDSPVGKQIRNVNIGNVEYSLKELVILTDEELAILNATPKPKNPPFNDSFILYDYFDHNKFYRKGWTVSIKKDSSQKWLSGSFYFSNYMNNVYKVFQENVTESTRNLLVYASSSTNSVVSQLLGVCDSLLLALLNERLFQYHAPGLPAHLFDSPLPDVIYPVELRGKTLGDRYENNTITFEDKFKHRLVYTGVDDEHAFSLDKKLRDYDDAILFTATTNFTSKLCALDKYRSNREKIFGIANSEALGDMDWTGSCITSLFQPSKYFHNLLKKWTYRFKGHTVLGVQISSQHIVHDIEASIPQSRLDVLYAAIDKFMNSASRPIVFISSDQKKYSELLLERYNGHCLTTKTQFQTQPGFTPLQAKYYHDLIDLYLLSMCNELIVTPDSMFGATAISMNPRLSRTIPSVFDPNKKVVYLWSVC